MEVLPLELAGVPVLALALVLVVVLVLVLGVGVTWTVKELVRFRR